MAVIRQPNCSLQLLTGDWVFQVYLPHPFWTQDMTLGPRVIRGNDELPLFSVTAPPDCVRLDPHSRSDPAQLPGLAEVGWPHYIQPAQDICVAGGDFPEG